jgi:hypothetical protein
MKHRLPLSLAGLCAILLAWPPTLLAQEEPSAKLTVGHYRYRGGGLEAYSGQDVNLRWRVREANAWVGVYRDRVFGSQTRAGVDTSLDLVDGVSLQPSLQAATRGFLGGSVNLTAGRTWYALVGWGRTNLKPYFNLNFDPNDAVTAGVGWRGEGGRNLMAYVVADDRLGTRQRSTHLFMRWPMSEGLRLTLDLTRKTGRGDDGEVNARGLTATLDWPTWFVRLGRDPRQNFTAQDATRVAAGVRF